MHKHIIQTSLIDVLFFFIAAKKDRKGCFYYQGR